MEECVISNTERKIKIVDDIMGSGKSTMAINHINANQNKKFLCIVPLLDECNRYKKYTKINIVDPKNWGSKWKQFRCLVEDDMNIVTQTSHLNKCLCPLKIQ